MNELMIVLEGHSWLYYKTEQGTVQAAFREFCKVSEDAGINFDNARVIKLELRDKIENTIDTVDVT